MQELSARHRGVHEMKTTLKGIFAEIIIVKQEGGQGRFLEILTKGGKGTSYGKIRCLKLFRGWGCPTREHSKCKDPEAGTF